MMSVKMSDKPILKVCKIHGPLTHDDIYFIGQKGGAYIVKKCMYCKNDKYANRDKVKANEDVKRRYLISRELLTDSYIKQTLKHQWPLPARLIPQALIELKRASLDLKRRLQAQQEENAGRLDVAAIELSSEVNEADKRLKQVLKELIDDNK